MSSGLHSYKARLAAQVGACSGYVSVSLATCEVNEESSSSLSSPGNPAAEVNELLRDLAVPVRIPGLLPSAEGLAIQLRHRFATRSLTKLASLHGVFWKGRQGRTQHDFTIRGSTPQVGEARTDPTQ